MFKNHYLRKFEIFLEILENFNLKYLTLFQDSKKNLKCQIQIQSFISWLHNHNLKLFLRPKTRFFLAFHFSVTNSIFSWWQTSHRISCWQKLVNKFRFRNVDGCSGRNVWHQFSRQRYQKWTWTCWWQKLVTSVVQI